ncbi:hypothetical protein A2419_00325 [Candidatus Adlerbacteria bacterium RIFOXYC1_FULL_48_26]|uniref:DUF4446 domain-containing protein n=1 Tax=Candidatus Adlerbacteria bacterium RIFOXYC1_FULL_48_26 TaxID=1797247 RepID=A0A1F4Y360_9BACT|nr:MAG: hypothetical protein A2419_00325 [Candidatus Adlerbacteria bacterium RIFOXYC1_FULL_48_26]
MSLASLYSWLTLAAPYMALGALLLSIIAIVLLLGVRRRFMRLALGRNGSIEESISILLRDTKELQHFRVELEKYLKNAELRLRGSVQGVGVVRFNAFAGNGAGGNQSFSAAFLDEELSGVVLSTLYSRNHVGVYAKPVEKGSSTFELTTEERDAIARAKLSIAAHKKRDSSALGEVSA